MPTTHDVTVIGCGLMGSAIARALSEQGLQVAAWNRSPAKAKALSAHNVTAFRDIAEAVQAAPLVIACTATYETTLSALEPATAWKTKTLVNVGSGTPDEAEQAQAWVTERGGTYLDGAALCYPPQIGTEEGLFLYAGPKRVWTRHRETLLKLGAPSTHVSDQVRGASVIDAALIGGFYVSALSAYVEAATFAWSEGVSAAALRDVTIAALETLKATTEEAAVAITKDRHTTKTATVAVYAEGARNVLEAMNYYGHRARVLAAAVENLNEAEAAGLGELGFSSLTKIARTKELA